MYDELIKNLRDCAKVNSLSFYKRGLMKQAADAIEELSKKYLDSEVDNTNLTGWLAEEHAKHLWIPVTERLPVGGDNSGAVCENVCLMMDDGTVSCGWMNGITKKVYYLNARDDFIIKAPITRVTHWMPLPQPPKEVRNGDT